MNRNLLYKILINETKMNLKLMGRRLNRFIPSTRFHHIPFKRFSLKLEYALWGGLRPSLSCTQFYWESYWNFSADEQYQEKCEFFLTISLWIYKQETKKKKSSLKLFGLETLLKMRYVLYISVLYIIKLFVWKKIWLKNLWN